MATKKIGWYKVVEDLADGRSRGVMVPATSEQEAASLASYPFASAEQKDLEVTPLQKHCSFLGGEVEYLHPNAFDLVESRSTETLSKKAIELIREIRFTEEALRNVWSVVLENRLEIEPLENVSFRANRLLDEEFQRVFSYKDHFGVGLDLTESVRSSLKGQLDRLKEDLSNEVLSQEISDED